MAIRPGIGHRHVLENGQTIWGKMREWWNLGLFGLYIAPNYINDSLIDKVYFVIFLYWVSTLLSRMPSLSSSSAMMAGGGAGRGGVGSS